MLLRFKLCIEKVNTYLRCVDAQEARAAVERIDRNQVWLIQCTGRCYGALNGCLLWQMQRLFKIKLLTEDGAFVEYWLSLALTRIPQNLGNLDPVSKLLQVRKAPAAVALQGFSVGYIVGYVNVF